MFAMRWRFLSVAVALVACGGDDSPIDAGDDDDEPESLAALGLFEDEVEQAPAEGVLPYDVNAVLYADESEKLRFISIPEGETIGYESMDLWDYPDGTRFVKTFFYYDDVRDPSKGRRLLETRIVEKSGEKWTGRTYVWNDAQTEARRLKVGKSLQVEWIDEAGELREQEYRVPNDNECKTCHSKRHVFEPLGPRTRQLNRDYDYGGRVDNQIDRLRELGWLDGDLDDAADRFTLAEPYGDEDLERRARGYLDANCGHCHRPGGEAGSSALDLRAETTDLHSLGVCRSPVAAGPGSGGRRHDIVPGDPEASILIFRMRSTDPQLKMPELPTLTSDVHGTELIAEWIAGMEPGACE